MMVIDSPYEYANGNAWLFTWDTVQFLVNGYFLVELLSDLIVYKLQAYKELWRVWPETIAAIMYITVIVNFIEDTISDEVSYVIVRNKLLAVIIGVRALRVFILLYEVESLRLILKTLVNL